MGTTTNDNDQRPEPNPPTDTPLPDLPHTETATGPKKGSPVAVSAWCKPSRGRACGEDEWKPETVEFPQPGTVQPVRPRTPPPPQGWGVPPKETSMATPSLHPRCVIGLPAPPPDPNPPRNLYHPIPPQTRNGEGGNGKTTTRGGRPETRLRRLRPPENYNTLQYATSSYNIKA